MNKIVKSAEVPKTLADKAEFETEKIRKAVKQGLNFSLSSIYRAKDVKRQLRNDQHGKCAYCERYLNGDYGAVEHYRPVKAYQQCQGSPLQSPGYYWLCYDWKNLLLSCDTCNSSYKRNLFPLADERERNIAEERIDKEIPLIINPVYDDPGTYIEYRQYEVCAKSVGQLGTIKGETTIKIFHLNDDPLLVESRRRGWGRYVQVKAIKKILSCCPNANLSIDLSEFTNDSAEFAGMFRYQNPKFF